MEDKILILSIPVMQYAIEIIIYAQENIRFDGMDIAKIFQS
jgi:hypothetical protein